MTNVQAKHRRKRLRLPTLARFHYWLVQASFTSCVLVCGFSLGIIYSR